MSDKYYDTPTNDAELKHLNSKISLDNEEKLPMKNKTLRQGLKEIYYEYCSNSSLHGVQYLGQQRPWKEIFFWLCVFVCSIYFCSQTIEAIYRKWNDTPVIVSFSERSTPIYDIPFPAITICPETRRAGTDGPTYNALLEAIEAGKGLPSNLTETQREEFLTLLHTCNFDTIEKELPRLSEEVIDYVRVATEMASPLPGQIVQCKWFGNEGSCEDLFTPTYTEDGLCYTFNGYNGTDLYREDTVQYQQGLENVVNVSSAQGLNRTLTWSLEGGYPKNEPLKTYPARVVSGSIRQALDSYLLIANDFMDYGCSGATQGYKIVLHTPDDVPLLSKRYVRISPDKEVSIAVKPVMVTTSDGIVKYPAEKRKCFMDNERHLKFFKVYSEKNCEMECLTNYTLSECGCVKFSMPRTADMPVCAEDKISCYIRAEDKMLLENFDKAKFNNEDNCNCMPSCTFLEYDIEISQADFDVNRALQALNENLDHNVSFSHLIIHFKDSEFITSKRSELYGFTDFLANCGGVLGLFMGFSILSLVEWLYHVTLRLWSNMKRKMD